MSKKVKNIKWLLDESVEVPADGGTINVMISGIVLDSNGTARISLTPVTPASPALVGSTSTPTDNKPKYLTPEERASYNFYWVEHTLKYEDCIYELRHGLGAGGFSKSVVVCVVSKPDGNLWYMRLYSPTLVGAHRELENLIVSGPLPLYSSEQEAARAYMSEVV